MNKATIYDFVDGWNSAISILEKADVEDVVKVVRCMNCKHYKHFDTYNKHFCNEYGGYVTENDFCSRAERKDEKR